ncbi:MAG: glycine cleavage system aminomethyltransferase GcvT [Rhodobacterales bacterium]|nr:glycine cleavage system aminomethyltransferase GcvT [Rhodobacterales bacterium]
MAQALKRTPLYELHCELGAKLTEFAGYEMPVQYSLGILGEHQHTRTKAGLFDVSHMGQIILRGSSYQETALAFERAIPMDVLGLKVGRQRYGFLTTDGGGILDDLMFSNRKDHIFAVLNAACKDSDIVHLRTLLEPEISIEVIENRALIALQGPASETVLSEFNSQISAMKFMDIETLSIAGTECWISRSGYTGEDGFEISIPSSAAEAITRSILSKQEVEFIGLGARDSLRLEAGLCLYGHDIDEETTPVEASLTWAIQKARRTNGERANGFLGDEIITQQLDMGTYRKRVGFLPQTRAPMREGVEIYETESSKEVIGKITSGGYGPTVGHPVAMGYINSEYVDSNDNLFGELRGKRVPVKIAKLPFVPLNFKR